MAVGQRRRLQPTGAAATAAAATATAARCAARQPTQRFLKLLVAQMQNQDPLNPMDNAAGDEPDGADQHRQRHREAQHHACTGLSSQFGQLQVLQGASLVGHDVLSPGNRSLTQTPTAGEEPAVPFGVELPGRRRRVKVEILRPSGKVVRTIEAGPLVQGVNGRDGWDGKDASGNACPRRLQLQRGRRDDGAPWTRPR